MNKVHNLFNSNFKCRIIDRQNIEEGSRGFKRMPEDLRGGQMSSEGSRGVKRSPEESRGAQRSPEESRGVKRSPDD